MDLSICGILDLFTGANQTSIEKRFSAPFKESKKSVSRKKLAFKIFTFSQIFKIVFYHFY